MDCKNNNNELTASGSYGNRYHMFYRTFYQTKIKEFVTERSLSQKKDCSIDVTYFMCYDPSKWNEKFVGAVSVWKKIATDLLE